MKMIKITITATYNIRAIKINYQEKVTNSINSPILTKLSPTMVNIH